MKRDPEAFRAAVRRVLQVGGWAERPEDAKVPDSANARVVAAMHAWAAEMDASPPGSAISFIAAELTRRMGRGLRRAPCPPELAPQPPPANPPRGEPVWPLVITEAEDGGEDPRLVALMRAREAQGRAKYGVPLSAHDGRNTALDALQGALDLIGHLRKLDYERGEGNYWHGPAREAGEMAKALIHLIDGEAGR